MLGSAQLSHDVATELGAAGLDACAIEWLGSAMDLSPDDFNARVQDAVTHPDPGVSRSWLRLLAREALLRSFLQDQTFQPLPNALESIQPFPKSGATCADLMGRRGAAGVFPLDRQDTVGMKRPRSGKICGASAAVFVTQRRPADKWSAQPTNHPTPEDNWHRFFLVVSADSPNLSPSDFTGTSFQLAEALAQRAAKSGSAGAIKALARNWALSGSVEGDFIQEVIVGSKLAAPDLKRRRFLFPKQSRQGFAQRALMESESLSGSNTGPAAVQFASDINQAWSLIESGTPRHHGEDSLPTDVPVLHTFVSTAWQVVLGAIFLLRPRRLVLWTSPNPISKKPAEAIKTALADPRLAWLGCHVDTIRTVSSENLAQAHRELAGPLLQDLKQGAVWFNVTNGNRLMSYAALPFAQLDDRLTLIYRDVDAADCEFTALSYDGVTPVTTRRRGTFPQVPRQLPETARTALFGRNPNPPKLPTADAILRALGIAPDVGNLDESQPAPLPP